MILRRRALKKRVPSEMEDPLFLNLFNKLTPEEKDFVLADLFLKQYSNKNLIKYTCLPCGEIWFILDGPNEGGMYCPKCGVFREISEKNREKQNQET